jgi:hypothetical protein
MGEIGEADESSKAEKKTFGDKIISKANSSFFSTHVKMFKML